MIEIPISIEAKDITAHARGCWRSLDFRLRRARTFAGSTCSPRSSEVRRRPSSRLKPASCPARAQTSP
jgi:hypothetical protein